MFQRHDVGWPQRLRRALFSGLNAVLLVVLGLVSQTAGARSCPPQATAPSAEQASRLAAEAKDRGLLWRISRGGRSSYLYGSLHIGRQAWAYPGPKLRAALQASEVLALELDLDDPATRQLLLAPPAHAEPLALDRKLQARLDAQATAACLPASALAALHPLMQLSTYTVLAAQRDGLDPTWGQEAMLSRWAQQQKMPIVALEDAAEQLRALIPASAELARSELQQGLEQLEQGQVRPAVRRLAEVWARGDLKQLADYPRWCRCADSPADRAALRRLNDERNPLLAQRITTLHQGGQTVFAAVGALHMSGPQALPRLLREQGFEIEQLLP
ncbi:TraB/GumN family protein [Paucibacter sp. APW11]|uniref:TraB/GumN family protein n=1 Tax=Roseateles aquae TaxID=3077235 RepID=A0ABU3PC25_9BURK|nr:TraB/GumN family protein [Paucibacter sp. APW11]MDT9000116.1 TraB/GumN family protein [Paucibacter sp. APW11]